MKKFKFLFLIALIATMLISCAQSADDTVPVSELDARPTVVSVSTAYKSDNGSVRFFKTVSVTYSDYHVDKYEIITTPANLTKNGNWYYIYSVTLLNELSQIDFFNGTPAIVIDKNKDDSIEIKFNFSEIYTKVE